MQKLKTIFLLVSLTAIICSCGKQSEENNNHSRDDQQNLYDYDGDFIPNHKDARPFVADLPAQSLKGKIEIENKEYSFDLNNLDQKELIHYLAHNLRKTNLRYSLSINPSTNPLNILESGPLKVKVDLSKDSNIFDLDIQVQSKDNTILAGILDENHNLDAYVTSQQMKNKSLSLVLRSYSFKREDKLFNSQELNSSLNKSCYKLTIIKDELTESFWVAKNLKIKEAFQVIGHEDLYNEVFNSKPAIQSNDLQSIPDSTKSWFVLNKENQVNAGDHLIFIQATAQKLKSVPGEKEIFSTSYFKPSIEISLNQLTKISFKITGEFHHFSPSQQILKTYRRNFSRGFNSPKFRECLVTQYSYNEFTHSFNLSNIDDFFDATIDGKKIQFSKFFNGKRITLKNLNNKQKISINLKNKFNLPSILTGIQRGTSKNPQGGSDCHIENFWDNILSKKVQFGTTSHKGLRRIKVDLEIEREFLIH